MASPINTGGFAVNVMPGINYPDPRLLTPAYGSLIPAARQGLGIVGDFAQIRENARMAPVRQELAQIQLQQAQADAARAPIKAEMDRLQLAQLRQPIRTRIGSEIVRTPVTIGEDVEIPAGTEIPTGFDVQAQDIIQVYDPVTGGFKTERVGAKPIMTAEQIKDREALADYREQLAVLRAQQAAEKAAYDAQKAETDRIKAEADRIRADAYKARMEALNSNPALDHVDVKQADGRTVRQYFVRGNPTQIVEEIDRGVLSSSIFLPGGTVNISTPNAVSPGGTPALTDIAARFRSGQTAPATAAVKTPVVTETVTYTAANPARPTNKAEYDALPSGSFYIAQDGVTLKQKK